MKRSPRKQKNSTTASDRMKVVLVLIGLLLINIAIFAPVRHHDFVTYDDPEYVVENSHIHGGVTWDGIVWAFSSGYAANWHPLTWISHMIDVQMFGLDAGWHHLTNVVFHVVNCCLLFAWLFSMTKALGRSAFVAALFAAHPLHVESVAWVAERKDVLSAFFGLLALCAYVAYVRQPSRARYVLVAVLFGLGLMAKPMLVTLPFVMMLVDFWPLRRVDPPLLSKTQWPVVRILLGEKVPLLALAAVSSVITVVAQHHAGAVQSLAAVPLDMRIFNAAISYVAYLAKTLWPARLAIFYPFPNVIPAWKVLGSFLFLVITTALVWRAASRCRYLVTGWFWYLGTLVPVIGLVQVGDQSMADRYSYLSLVGLFLMAAWGLPDIVALMRQPRSKVLAATAILLIVACTVAARGQVRYWENNGVLWRHALEVTEDNHLAHVHIGNILLADGKPNEAIREYSEALRTRPNFDLALDNLGIVLLNQGRTREAFPLLLKAVQVYPNFAHAQNDLGVALERDGRTDEAIAHYTQAIHLDPNLEVAHVNLAKLLATHGRVDEAVREYLEASHLKPDDPIPHYDLGIVFNSKGNTNRAIAEFETALRLKPGYTEAQRALMTLTHTSSRQ